MAKYVISYRAPKDYVPGREDDMAAWAAWFTSIGEDLVDFGSAVRDTIQIGDCGAGQRLRGYSVISADDPALRYSSPRDAQVSKTPDSAWRSGSWRSCRASPPGVQIAGAFLPRLRFATTDQNGGYAPRLTRASPGHVFSAHW